MRSASCTTDGHGTMLMSGEVDILSAPMIRAALAAEPDMCALDCAAVTFIDTAGLDAILTAARPIRLVNPSHAVARLIEHFDRLGLWRDGCPVLVSVR